MRRPWIAVAGFVVFGAIGLWSYLANPLGATSTGVIAAVLSTAAGIGTLFALLWLLGAGHERPGFDDRGRLGRRRAGCS